MLLAAMLASAFLMLGAVPAQAGQRRAMVRAINAVRAGHLSFSKRISKAAAAWARHLMASNRLAHSSRAHQCGQGEVIEWHSGTAGNVRGVVSEWLGSAPHHLVMMNPVWHRAGAGRATGWMNGRRSTIWVVRFAR